MAVIGSDGLSLLIGDGAGTESFAVLKGATITQLDITQKPHPSPAIANDAWQVQAGISDRQVIVECESMATDEAPMVRLKSLAMTGVAGKVKLQLRSTETINMSVFVTQYSETIAAGKTKLMRCRLESSGAVSLV